MAQRTYHVGFQSLDSELERERLDVEGEIPAWLSGTLVRNGPGKFEVGEQKLRHWFDGLAMLRRYEFSDGEVRYSNQFLRTESYEDAMNGELTGQFATDRGGLDKLRAWLSRLGPPEPTDNANVHVARIDDTLVAQTEVPRWVGVDAETLATTGEFTFHDTFAPDMITAHLVEDPDSGDHFGHAITFGRTHQYHLFRIPAGTRRREVVASIPTDKPAYVHSIGVSESHLLLVETPLRISIRRALSPFTEGFFEMLDWDSDRDTRIYVVDRSSGDVVRTATHGPFFTFHTVNAFDDGDDVVLDLVAFSNERIVDALSLATVSTEGFEDVPPGRFRRYRISPGGSVTETQLYDGGTELPAIAPSRQTRPYRYMYGQATDRVGANGLVKVDVHSGVAREWWDQNRYVEEPCFVQHPDASAEDDGVVLAPTLDTDTEQSELVVFDAATLDELARATVPHHNPFGFHGRFFPKEQL